MVKFTPDTSEISEGIFKVNISDSELPTGQDVLICGKGLVSEIQGSSYDDIIESGGIQGAQFMDATEATSLKGLPELTISRGTKGDRLNIAHPPIPERMEMTS